MDTPELGQVLDVVDGVRREWHASRIFGGLSLFLALVLGLTFLLVVAAMLVPLPTAVRWGFMLAWLGCLVGLAVVLVFKRLFENPTDEQVAVLIETSQPDLHNEIINAIRFSRESSGQDRVFLRAALRESGSKAADLDARGAVNWRDVRRYALGAGGMVLVWVVLLVGFRARAGNALSRIMLPAKNLEKIGSVRILEVTPGDVTVIVGENLKIGALLDRSLEGRPKPQVQHHVVGGPVHSERMYPSDENRFTCELLDIRTERSYRVAAGDSLSRSFKITVTERPRVTRVPAVFKFPAYTKLAARTIEDTGGVVRALRGTEAALSIVVNKRLKSARLIIGADEPVNLLLAPGRMEASAQRPFIIRENTPGRIEIVDEFDCSNDRAIDIVAVEDAAPQVKITAPAEDRVLAVGASLDLAIRGTDDYGIVRAQLIEKRMRAGSEKVGDPQVVKTWAEFTDGKSVAIHWTWKFEKKSYENGDIVRYFVTMVDNNGADEPGVGSSAEFVVRVEDAVARQKQRDEKYKNWEERVEALLREQRELRRTTGELAPEGDAGGAKEPKVTPKEKKDGAK